MNLSCFAFLQKWPLAQPCCTCFHVIHATLKLPTWNLPVDWDQQGFDRVNVARVKGFSLAYLHVIHFETSRFNIKSFARVLLLFFRSFPVHLENYPECISRTIGWARGPWEDTSYQYLLGNFKDGERSWLSMLKLYLKQSFIQLRAKCNKSLWIMPGLWLPVWLQRRPYRIARWTNVQIFSYEVNIEKNYL